MKTINLEQRVLNNFPAIMAYTKRPAPGIKNIIGQELFEAIDDAVKNKRVKALFYVLTPRGSALSSDIIWNALKKAKEKKPL